MNDIKTIEVHRFAIRLDEVSEEICRAAEKLAEAILKHKYPMIPNQTYDHHWTEAGLVTAINCPSVIQYVETESGDDL